MKKLILGLLLISNTVFASEHVGEWVSFDVKVDGIDVVNKYELTGFDADTSEYILNIENMTDDQVISEEVRVPEGAVWNKNYAKTVLKNCESMGGVKLKKDYGKGLIKVCKVSIPNGNQSVITTVLGALPVLGFAESYSDDMDMIIKDYHWNN